MKLLVNALSALQGGGQVYISSILPFVKKYPDIETYVVCDPQFAHLYDNPSVEVLTYRNVSKKIMNRLMWEKFELPRIQKKLKIDLVFYPGGIISFEPSEFCKTAVTFQNMLIFDEKNRKKYPFGTQRLRLFLLEQISKRSFANTDLVIFISDFAKNVIDNLIPQRKGKSVVIHHGLNESFRTAGKNQIPRCPLLPEGEYLLYVSVINTFKAQIEVLYSYHNLTQKRKTKEKLLFVGPKYYRYEKMLRGEIRRLHLEDKAIIIGEIPAGLMPSVFHYAKAHIFASTCENCPNIVIESLGSGRPLFLSKILPMPEIAGSSAVYFDPYRPQELACLLNEYLDNEELMNEMGRRAFERSFNFDWSKTAHQTFEAFENLFTKKEVSKTGQGIFQNECNYSQNR